MTTCSATKRTIACTAVLIEVGMQRRRKGRRLIAVRLSVSRSRIRSAGIQNTVDGDYAAGHECRSPIETSTDPRRAHCSDATMTAAEKH